MSASKTADLTGSGCMDTSGDENDGNDPRLPEVAKVACSTSWCTMGLEVPPYASIKARASAFETSIYS